MSKNTKLALGIFMGAIAVVGLCFLFPRVFPLILLVILLVGMVSGFLYLIAWALLGDDNKY